TDYAGPLLSFSDSSDMLYGDQGLNKSFVYDFF
ncbi:hypothetical protein A2U01_0089658, partial [Trifolium medium]|nr:hypothetical protein [Trifolium medium]